MTFTPEDVERQEFLTAVRGYDKHAVRQFLKVLAEQMRTSAARVAAVEDELDALRNQGPGRAAPADEVEHLMTALRDQLSLATRLVEKLGRPAAASETATPAETGVAPEPVPKPPRRRGPEPPPEWDDLLADPTGSEDARAEPRRANGH